MSSSLDWIALEHRLTCVHLKFAVGIGLNLTVRKQNNSSKNCLLAVGRVFLVICLQEGWHKPRLEFKTAKTTRPHVLVHAMADIFCRLGLASGPAEPPFLRSSHRKAPQCGNELPAVAQLHARHNSSYFITGPRIQSRTSHSVFVVVDVFFP